MPKFDNGCPHCGGTVGHAPDCPKGKTGATYGVCAICRKPIDADDRVYMLDDNEKIVCEHCMIFSKDTLVEFLDMLGVEYYAGKARVLNE